MGSNILTDEEAVNAYVSNLKNEELSEALKSYSFKPGPITRTTRTLYEKRLKKILSAQIPKDETTTTTVETTEIDNNSQQQATEIHNNVQHQTDNTVKTDCNHKQVDSSLKIESAGNGSKDEKNIINQTTENKNAINKSKCGPSNNEKQYFVVQVPNKKPYIFESKEEALKTWKSLPHSRFKSCSDLESANDFGQKSTYEGLAFTKIRTEKVAADQASNVENTTANTSSRESLPFGSVKFAELCAFRVALEKGNVETVKKLVWSNPRYLIGSGDNPTVLQEGCRYNALHVCCKSNQLETCRVVIETINNPDFYSLLYTDEMPENRMMRLDFVVDLYLNNREKGNYETPLHLASKFGHIKLVEFLLSQPQIKKDLKNEPGLTAMEVACSRVAKPSKELKQKILSAFEDQYYVFVLRSEDNSEPPQISRPFCPSLDKNLRGPIVPYLDQSPRSYRGLFDSPSNQVTSVDLMNVNARPQPPSFSVLPSSNLSLAFSCKNPEASVDDYVPNGKNISSSSLSQTESSSIKSSLNDKSDLPISCVKTSTCSKDALRNSCSDSKLFPRSVDSKIESAGSGVTTGSKFIPIKRLFCSNNESKSEVSFEGVERSVVNSQMLSVIEEFVSVADESNQKILDASKKTCSVRSVDSLSSIPDTKSEDFKAPSSTSTVRTPLKSWSYGEPATPVSGSSKKVPIVCKTPKNKQLILLTTTPAGLEQNQPSCVKNDDQSNFKLNVERKSDQDAAAGSDLSAKTNTPRSRWEKLIDIPVFSATDSPRRIRAIAGPMPKQKSEFFRRRVLLTQATPEEKNSFSRIRRTDSNKGLERVCRNIATEMNVSWSEYWEFLDCEVDLTSKDGLELLEGHLKDTMDFSISICEQQPIKQVPEVTADKLKEDEERKEFETLLCSAFSKLTVKSPTSGIPSTVAESSRPRENGDFTKNETFVMSGEDHSNNGTVESKEEKEENGSVGPIESKKESSAEKVGSVGPVESKGNLSNGNVESRNGNVESRNESVESRNESDKNSSDEDQRSSCSDENRDRGEESEDSEEEKEVFLTPEESDKFSNPQSKLQDVEEFFELNSRRNLGMFIHGDLPTRTDADVFRALESMEDLLRAYPLIFNWFTLVRSYTELERSRIFHVEIMKCRAGMRQVKKSGKWPCSVCRKGVGSNSICCVDCKSWVHKRWSEVTSLNHCLSTPRLSDRNLFSGDCETSYDSPSVVRNLKHFF